MDNAVDIVIPYYNKKDFIERAVESVLSQARQSIINKIIIIDDGSDKEHKDFLFNRYGDNKKIRIVRQPNKGLFKARLRGLNCCEAPFMCFLDADDELHSNWSIFVSHWTDQMFRQKFVPTLAYEMCCQYKDFTDYDCTEPYLSGYSSWTAVINDGRHFDHSACNKLISRDVYTQMSRLLSNVILPSSRLNFMEDILFSCLLISLNDNFTYTDNVGYIYHKEAENSILKTESDKEPFIDYFKEVSKIVKFPSVISKFVSTELSAV